ncbi:MAG: hypothetical protein ABIK62_06465, partial [candidate division WOR-3 bacterium]
MSKILTSPGHMSSSRTTTLPLVSVVSVCPRSLRLETGATIAFHPVSVVSVCPRSLRAGYVMALG